MVFVFILLAMVAKPASKKSFLQIANSLTPDRCTDQAIWFKFRVGFICEIPTGVLANFSIISLSFSYLSVDSFTITGINLFQKYITHTFPPVCLLILILITFSI